MKPDLRKRLTERGAARSDAQVTCKREIAAGARSWTIDRRDHGLRHLTDRENHASPGAEYARKLLGIATLHQLGHECDVAAGTKCAARARYDHDANTAIAARVFERFSQIATHVADERIQLVRTIQRDRHDSLSLSDLNVVVHQRPLNSGLRLFT